jgi:allantoin racemase
MRFVLINPNTSTSTTSSMVRIAGDAAPQAGIVGMTAKTGVPLITDPAALASAARAVVDLAPQVRAHESDGVIVSAFGDPGLAQLSTLMDCPVTGIAEAAMEDAATRGAQFAVVTTTPLLIPAIAATAARYGHAERFLGTVVTEGDPGTVMADPDALEAALGDACCRAISELRADALIIGGGPLAVAARGLRDRFEIPIIEPIPAAMAMALRRAVGG